MHKLAMATPLADVLRLLVKKFRFTEAVESDWLRRGRERIIRGLSGSKVPSASLERLLERFLPDTDPTPDAVRKAAYRVEARTSLLRAVTDLTVCLALVVIAVSGSVAAFVDTWTGIVIGIIGTSGIAGLHVRGTRLAIEAVEWRQGMEPVAWALYYPVQRAQEITRVSEEISRKAESTLGAQWAALESQIERDENGHALPGQEPNLWAYVEYLSEEQPRLFSAIDSSRDIAADISRLAPAAAQLVEGEYRRQLSDSPYGATRARRQVAERNAARVYGHLMTMADSFCGLPRAPWVIPAPDVRLGRAAEEAGLEELVEKAESLIESAEAFADVPQASTAEGWTRPPSRRAATLSAAAGVIIAGTGWYLNSRTTSTELGGALIAIGAVFIPGTVGKAVKESVALHAKS